MKTTASALAVLALLAGCATGIKMTDQEAAACRAEGCTVWTDAELQGLVLNALRQGYQQGARSAGRAL